MRPFGPVIAEISPIRIVTPSKPGTGFGWPAGAAPFAATEGSRELALHAATAAGPRARERAPAPTRAPTRAPIRLRARDDGRLAIGVSPLGIRSRRCRWRRRPC